MDRLIRGVSGDEEVRVVAAITSETVREACRRHDAVGAEAVILGRLITAATLLATLTKRDDERVRIEVRGNGPIGRGLADAYGNGTVRGCLITRLPAPAMPHQGASRDEIGDLVGRGGHVVVTRDMGLDQAYQGVVEIHTGELDLDLERYLVESEQLPSTMRCRVILDAEGAVVRAAGVLCQTFPGADGARIDRLRDNLDASDFGDVLRSDRSAEELVGFALLGGEHRLMSATEVRFECNCGPRRALAVVSTLGADDLEQLVREQGGTDVRCTYCGVEYSLSAEQLTALASRMRAERS